MQIILEQSFLKSASKLPDKIKKKLATLVTLLKIDPYNPLLHTKKLHGYLSGFLSFRVTRNWRVVFYFRDSDTICILDVDDRKNVYR